MASEPAVERNPFRTANYALGLAVFVLGIAGLVTVFMLTYGLYQGLGSGLGTTPAGGVTVPTAGQGPDLKAPLGAVKAPPDQPEPLVQTITRLGLRLVLLLALGWISSLVAGRGVAMAHQPPRRE